MVDSEVNIDVDLVRRLIGAQFPQWADLEVRPVEHSGWDNRTFHLGDEMSVRLPSAEAYAAQVTKEQKWLPVLAPHLPLPISQPLACGEPGEGYVWHWSVYRWLEGDGANVARVDDLTALAGDLGRFLASLRRVDATAGPLPGRQNFYRGGALSTYDEEARRAIGMLDGTIDGGAALAVWEAALASKWTTEPVWVHGDIAAGNLLVRDGKLSAVIDFGGCAVGDPACDLVIAWTLFANEGRVAFRAAVGLDDAVWARGRGWALWKALIMMAGISSCTEAEKIQALRIAEAVILNANI